MSSIESANRSFQAGAFLVETDEVNDESQHSFGLVLRQFPISKDREFSAGRDLDVPYPLHTSLAS